MASPQPAVCKPPRQKVGTESLTLQKGYPAPPQQYDKFSLSPLSTGLTS